MEWIEAGKARAIARRGIRWKRGLGAAVPARFDKHSEGNDRLIISTFQFRFEPVSPVDSDA